MPIRALEPHTYTDELPDLTPCQCVRVQVILPLADANRLAEHKRSRAASGADVLASEAREVADPVLEALVAAGYAQAQP
jgi:hypothetical protein